MSELNKVISYLENNLERVNPGRVSENWKAKIFRHKLYNRQVGIYKRDTMILVRLESYHTDIVGVVKHDKIPASDALDKASFSKFKDGKGVCVKVGTLERFKVLMDWYFSDLQN